MGETVGDNLDNKIPLTNCKVFYQKKKKTKKQNIKCPVCSEFSWVWLGDELPGGGDCSSSWEEAQ